MITLDALNAAPREQFTATLGAIFEHSAWVAERAAEARPFTSVRQLHDTMCAMLDQASLEEQLALIRAHPQLGSRGRRRAQLTAASAGEQTGAGLDACTDEEYARLMQFNAAYVAKFDFPFILAVRGHNPASIIANFEQRVSNDAALERRRALEEIGKIAGYRLADLVATPNLKRV
jgi:OHCU decarboxylase